MEKSNIDQIVRSIKVYLETDRMAGINELYTAVSLKPIVAAKAVPAIVCGPKPERLQELRNRTEECKGCTLFRKRTNLVFGVGDENARLMFVGEAPGQDEDLKGEPFVGRAGQLLTKMIEAMGLSREKVYIANILKCRPPNNRIPQPEEIEACTAFLTEQIKIIEPKVICTLGKFASQFLLKSEVPISALRGKFYELNGIKVMPTYHPAYLLRNPNDKKLVWEDLKKIRDEIKTKT